VRGKEGEKKQVEGKMGKERKEIREKMKRKMRRMEREVLLPEMLFT